jgi:hypothetical protein
MNDYPFPEYFQAIFRMVSTAAECGPKFGQISASLASAHLKLSRAQVNDFKVST